MGFLTSMLSQNIKKIEGTLWRKRLKKVSQCRKKLKGGPFSLPRYCMIRGKRGKTFCFSSLGQIVTLAISKCYGKVRVLFLPRDNSLVSDRKSHNSDFFGLAVRCLLFNPEGPGSNPCLCAIFFYKIFEAEDSHFFRQYETPPPPFSAF